MFLILRINNLFVIIECKDTKNDNSKYADVKF